MRSSAFCSCWALARAWPTWSGLMASPPLAADLHRTTYRVPVLVRVPAPTDVPAGPAQHLAVRGWLLDQASLRAK